MTLYFVVMWTSAFFLVYYLSRRPGGAQKYGYKMAVVQASFAPFCRCIADCSLSRLDRTSEQYTRSMTGTYASFELAIAVCVAIYGVDSDQALAATIGPLVEVPVLLGLTYLSVFFQRRLTWSHPDDLETSGDVATA